MNYRCLVTLLLLLANWSTGAHAQQSNNLVPPTVGSCYKHERTTARGTEVVATCIKEVSATRLVYDSGLVWELPTFNVVEEAGRKYFQRTGVISSEPACWPVGAPCGASGEGLKDIEVNLDGKLFNESRQGRTDYPKFTLVTKLIDCEVLGKKERCLRSEIKALDQLANGNKHDVKATRIIALTGDARGAAVLSEYVQDPGFRGSLKLIEATPK